MTAPNGPFIGKGTTFSSSSDGGTTYVPYAKLVDIKPAQSKIGDVEVTGYDSTIEDFIPGWENAGEASFVINFQESSSAALYALRGVSKQFWKIQLPDGSSPTTGTTLVFQGYINEFGPETPQKQAIKTMIKIKLQSVITITAAT
jgi:hypothetical protein